MYVTQTENTLKMDLFAKKMVSNAAIILTERLVCLRFMKLNVFDNGV